MNNRKASSKKSFSHPLYGSDLSTLHTLVSRNGDIPKKHYPQILTAYLSAMMRLPIMLIEKGLTLREFRKMPSIPPPVFIIGHWRSGTTHLCNVMGKAPCYGYVSPIAAGLPWELLTIGRAFKPFLEKSLPSDRLIDKVPVTPESPQEDEFGLANMLHFSFLHGLYFPVNFKRNFNKGAFFDDCSEEEITLWKQRVVYYLKKVSIYQQHRPLLIRNPVYTTRMLILKELFPGAKFIHIYRNPYRLFRSMKNYYRKLFPALAMQPYDHVDVEHFILETYTRMMDKLLTDSREMSSEEFIEVRFEHFEQQPIQVLEEVFEQLGLENFGEAEPYFSGYLNSIKNYKKNVYRRDSEEEAIISERWQRFIDHWNYSVSV